MNFNQKLNEITLKKDSLVCVGLDPARESLPDEYKKDPAGLAKFCSWIVQETAPYAAAFKPNSAFFEAEGTEGIGQLHELVRFIKTYCRDVPVILDAKRADIGSTNAGYVRFAFESLGADAITLNPYLGAVALEPFLSLKDKGCIILCKTSNAGSSEFQGALIDGAPLHELVARAVTESWNKNGNCSLVVGATYPEELKRVRAIVGDLWLLIPGIGAQGGDLRATLEAGLTKASSGVLINSSRGIMYADSPAQAAKELKDQINNLRKELRP